MIATTQIEFTPGTNLKGDAPGAAWTFLLPALELGDVLCLGPSTPASLRGLAGRARSVLVLCTPHQTWRSTHQALQRLDLPHVQAVYWQRGEVLPTAGRRFNLIAIHGSSGCDAAVRVGDAGLDELLAPGGLVYVQLRALQARFRRGWLDALARRFHHRLNLRLWPLTGEVRAAVATDQPPAVRDRVKSEAGGGSDPAGWLGRARSLVSRCRIVEGTAGRRGILLSDAVRDLTKPPDYVRQIARAGGVDIDCGRWGLAAPGEYRSRKVLMFVYDSAGRELQYVVKMARTPQINPRLENECWALRELHERGLAPSGRLPQVAFQGRHADLAVVGLTAITGDPYRQRTTAQGDCPLAANAAHWLTELAAATADFARGEFEWGRALADLLGQLCTIYRLSADQHGWLQRQVDRLADRTACLPTVFQHGDPGTWNLRVDPSGRVAFLDWESADVRGVPLWDLFYFLRSHAVCVARHQGTRDSLRGFTALIQPESAFSRVLADAAHRYCTRIGLSQPLIEPLFYTCWMHRALKEATRLSPAHLQRGRYVTLLRWCIDHRTTLQRTLGRPPQ